MIQLTAISHLSNEILGLEVNVVRERMYDMGGAAGEVTGARPSVLERPKDAVNGSRGHFLVYSGFATSALVAPREALVDFWQRAFVADLIRRFAAGPSLSDPRTGLSAGDVQRVFNLWQSLLSQLVSRYAALDNERLDAIRGEIEEQQGAWHSFWQPVQQTVQQALIDTGIRGAIALCDLISPTTPATAPAESLPRQRLFLINGAPVTEEDRSRWRKVLAQEGGFGEQMRQVGSGFGDLLMTAFSPRQAKERASDMATRKARARLYQQRDALERVLVEQLGKQAALMREALRSQIEATTLALARANQDANRMAERIDPRIPDGSATTSTYYELETGAVGRDYLRSFYSRAGSTITAEDWQMALNPLFAQLVQGARVIDAEQIYTRMVEAVSVNSALRQRVADQVDINHIINTQRDQEVERVRQRPDNRIHQWLGRLNPYIRWDADRFSFHESNLEHIRLAAVPTNRQDDPGLMAATVGLEDFKWVPTGDRTRTDAVWIVHGLPVMLLERMDEYRAQYENTLDFPIRQEFHLNPEWVNLPDITLEEEPLPGPPVARPSGEKTR